MNNLKKIGCIVALACIGQLPMLAQTISSVFKAVPHNVLMGIEASEIDGLLLHGADSTIIIQSGFYPAIKRTSLSENFIALQTSDSAFLQIKLLPLVNDSKIICVLKSVCAKACDSQISFYTPTWKPIPKADLFPKTDLNWFFKDGIDRESQEFKNAITALDINFVKLQFSVNDNNIIAKLDIESYLSKDDYKALQPFLLESHKMLNWDKVSYK